MVDTIEELKNKLKSATKQKLIIEREVLKFRNLDRSFIEDITMTTEEMDFLKSQLEEIQIETSKVRHQISLIEICKSSEKMKNAAHINTLEGHRQGFAALFNTIKEEAEIKNKELCDKEAEKQGLLKQRQMQVILKNEEQLQETLAVEAECDALERECSVLKKRNTAIMLKLRRKLVETEDVRREILKRKHEERTTNKF